MIDVVKIEEISALELYTPPTLADLDALATSPLGSSYTNTMVIQNKRMT